MTFQLQLSGHRLRILAFLLAIAGSATIALALFGPRIGLGVAESSVSSSVLGLTRATLIVVGATAIALAIWAAVATRRKRVVRLDGSSYQTVAVISLNFLLLFVVANMVALLFLDLGTYDAKAHRDQWLARHGMETIRRVYPGLSDKQIDEMLLQAGHFGLLFEPYIHTKSQPMVLEHTAFHTAGFRLIGRDQGPWPISKDAMNVFVFGGSTIVGSGVRDDQAIPAVLQRLLREQFGNNSINVYNFATAGHYSTQERIYFEQLLLHGHIPDAAVFVDGLNDFFFWADEPAHTNDLRQAFMHGASRNNPYGLVLALRELVLRLPLARLVQPYYERARSGKMPTAAIISPVHAEANKFADPVKIDGVIERYFRFKQMAEGVARSFSVTPIFVWQPVPLYDYDPALRLFPVVGDHLRHEFGYPVMAQRVRELEMSPDFIWCADAFQTATQPLYLDSVHYATEGNEIVARCVVQAIAANGLLQSKLK